MSQWVTRFEQHPVHDTLKHLEVTLSEAAPPSEAEPEAVQAYARLQQFLVRFRGRLEATDPSLTPTSPLDNFHSWLSAAINEVRNYTNNRRVGHLHNANQQVDNVLANLGALPMLPTRQDVTGIGRAAQAYHATIERHLTALEGRVQSMMTSTAEAVATSRTSVDQLLAQSQAASQEIKDQKGRLDQAIATFQEQFSKSQDEHRAEFARQEARRTEGAAQEEEKRREQFAAATAQRHEEFTGFMDRLRARQEEALQAFTEEAVGVVGTLRAHRKTAEELVHATANAGMTGGYQQAAETAAKRARAWHMITVAAMVGLVAIALWVFVPVLTGTVEWPSVIGRIFVSLTVGVLAGYAAKQAAKEQDAEARNRRMALELASIDPYLTPLPPEDQREVKRRMADRFFGRDEAEPAPLASANGGPTTGTLRDTLQLILDHLPNSGK